MNRLVRNALILLVSGTLMMFLAQERLALVESIHSSTGKSGNMEDQIQMGYLGLIMAGLMIAAAVGFIITATLRARKGRKLASYG